MTDEKALDKAIRQASEAAAYLKENDERIKALKLFTPCVTFDAGLMGDEPRYLTLCCAGPNNRSLQMVVFTKEQAMFLIEHFTKYVAILDEEEEETK